MIDINNFDAIEIGLASSKEIQSLSLDANVVSEGGEVEMADEEDDLLRAAEELGIELSGVRAGDGNGDGASKAADEKEEQVVAEGDGGTDGGDAEEAAKK